MESFRFLQCLVQVASGRFGVTPQFLANADQLEIKIAQGAKPGTPFLHMHQIWLMPVLRQTRRDKSVAALPCSDTANTEISVLIRCSQAQCAHSIVAWPLQSLSRAWMPEVFH